MNPKRVKFLRETASTDGNVAYWMSREQRINDNWALIFAQKQALERKKPLFVFYNQVPSFLEAGLRQFDFMLEGLKQVEQGLRAKNINFILTTGAMEKNIPELVEKYCVDLLVTDFSPLKIKKAWTKEILTRTDAALCEVDSSNIVPCREASEKQEYGAYTIRPKIKKRLYDFLEGFPEILEHPYKSEQISHIDWDKVIKSINADKSVSKIDWLKPGEGEALKVMRDFIDNKLKSYNQDRNDPSKYATSNLSPYLNYGQICSQRIVMEVMNSDAPEEAKDAFIEEITVRKELADNFCYYNENYDNTESFPNWAKLTLKAHSRDQRPYLYSLEEFELAKTHDDLWNAAQFEMVTRGKMHGYMRMYWAKKILEWSESPQKAMEIAIYLNNKYELDGCSPNGYTGIAWAIGGVHDRAWGERPVFGKIRYMSSNGAKSKFDVNKYIQKYV